MRAALATRGSLRAGRPALRLVGRALGACHARGFPRWRRYPL